MSTFTPFSEPLCLAIAASTIGVAAMRLRSMDLGYWLQAAAWLAGMFGAVLFGRLALDLAPPGWGIAATLFAGAFLPPLVGVRLAHASHDEGPESGHDDFARKGFAGILLASAGVTLVIAWGSTGQLAQVPPMLLWFCSLVPTLVAVSVLRSTG